MPFHAVVVPEAGYRYVLKLTRTEYRQSPHHKHIILLGEHLLSSPDIAAAWSLNRTTRLSGQEWEIRRKDMTGHTPPYPSLNNRNGATWHTTTFLRDSLLMKNGR
ncbi:hypothetical protein CEXT_119311 [Caerostris extrusa]|uniref:Uncharacterized protein n=1 Tax=Caerostris extrusa TaxID=172846 RepID=A0AAV4MSM0_CAEEX|nr:hypothetical protein CEXT_119311 [Caerostris extrusa]